VADFTYGATWKGLVDVAVVIDPFARRIVGWRVSHSVEAGFVLDALEQALHACRPVESRLVHQSDSSAVARPRLRRRSDQGPPGA
jgi:transposase InsO family protein